MNNEPINIVSEIKYLGVVINRKLSWNSHVDYICKKAMNIYQQLIRTNGKFWGLSGDLLRTIYLNAIEPLICYASDSWGNGVSVQRNRDKLLSLQRRFAIMITRSYRTVSCEASLILANIEPIDLKIRYWAQRKQKTFTQTIGSARVQHPVRFKDLDHPAKFHKLITTRCFHGHDVQVFTDGSLLRNRTGSAFVALDNDSVIHQEQFRLGDGCTVYQAELYAITRAVEWIHTTISVRQSSTRTRSHHSMPLTVVGLGIL